MYVIKYVIYYVFVLKFIKFLYYFRIGIVGDGCYVCVGRINVKFVDYWFDELFYLYLVVFFNIFRWINYKCNI